MHKKAHLTLKLTGGDRPAVAVGAKVIPGDILVTATGAEIDEFNLAKLLGVSPKDITALLVIKENTPVKKGDVIASKKGLMSKQAVRSPVEGEFIIVNKDTGIVGIRKQKSRDDIVSWFSGHVTELSDEAIIFELAGVTLDGVQGKGHPVSGMLLYSAGDVDLLTMPIDLDQKILALKDASADIIAKADALGVNAIIAETISQPPFSLPFIVVADIEAIGKYQNKTIIVYGNEKQILVLEEKDHASTNKKKDSTK